MKLENWSEPTMLDARNAESIKAQMLAAIKKTKINPEDYSLCEILDLSPMEKDINRNLRTIQRTFADSDSYCSLYFQISPGRNWASSIGLLGAIPQELSQEALFQAQNTFFECRGNDTANTLYYKCRNMPYEDAVLEYMFISTVLQLKKALAKSSITKPVYAGISKSPYWILAQ